MFNFINNKPTSFNNFFIYLAIFLLFLCKDLWGSKRTKHRWPRLYIWAFPVCSYSNRSCGSRAHSTIPSGQRGRKSGREFPRKHKETSKRWRGRSTLLWCKSSSAGHETVACNIWGKMEAPRLSSTRKVWCSWRLRKSWRNQKWSQFQNSRTAKEHIVAGSQTFLE